MQRLSRDDVGIVGRQREPQIEALLEVGKIAFVDGLMNRGIAAIVPIDLERQSAF